MNLKTKLLVLDVVLLLGWLGIANLNEADALANIQDIDLKNILSDGQSITDDSGIDHTRTGCCCGGCLDSIVEDVQLGS